MKRTNSLHQILLIGLLTVDFNEDGIESVIALCMAPSGDQSYNSLWALEVGSTLTLNI